MIRSFLGAYPVFDESNYIAPSAEVIGDVTLGREASIWFNTTVRADVNWVRIGAASNVQDNCVIHVSRGTAPVQIGEFVTIGHSAVIHGCTIHDQVLVGMGAVVLDRAVIRENTIVGARALVTQGMEVPPGSLVLGSPARVVRQVSEQEIATIRRFAENYLRYSALYRGVEKPEKNPFY